MRETSAESKNHRKLLKIIGNHRKWQEIIGSERERSGKVMWPRQHVAWSRDHPLTRGAKMRTYMPSELWSSSAHPKLSHCTRFRRIWPQPPLLPHVCERRAPPPLPPPYPHHPTTSSHCPPSPFHMVHPKLSHRARFCEIWPSAPSPASHLQMQSLFFLPLVKSLLWLTSKCCFVVYSFAIIL